MTNKNEIIEKIHKKWISFGNDDREKDMINAGFEAGQKESDEIYKRILVKIASKFGARETLLALGEFKDIDIEELKEEVLEMGK